MDYKESKFTLEDGITYLVVEQVNYENGIYLYIANADNESDTKFVEIKDDRLIPIDPVLFDKVLFPLFMDKFRQ
jgi:hypothetical protein